MEASLRDSGGGGGFHGGQSPALAQPVVPETYLPLDRGKPRAFPRKDPLDVLAPLAKKMRGEPQLESPPEAPALPAAEFLPAAEVVDFLQLLFGEKPNEQDVQRWFSVGFQFSLMAGTEWGLWQRHGGPCGVFAPVLAHMLRQSLFGDAAVIAERAERPLASLGSEDLETRGAVLAHALASMLFTSAPGSSYLVCQVNVQEGAAAILSTGNVAGNTTASVSFRRVTRVVDAQRLLEEGVGDWLAGPMGVVSFLCSVLLSRTLTAIRDDMDDPSTPLIGLHGHCSQELVNLMLIGEATSNVFDGNRWLGDDPSSGLLLRGVDGDRVEVPPVGYLTELEAMRYVSVGNLYKYPELPIWVLGSPTHYMLLFSTRRSDSQLSKEAQLEQKAKRAFADNSIDDGGLAMSTSLGKIISDLGLSEAHVTQAKTELVHEDIILWEDFRCWTRRQFGMSDASSEPLASNVIKLFLYDGQDPPGPTLRTISLEVSDIDPRHAGGSQSSDTFTATLHTRWPNAVVTVQEPV
eukprot:TRINITY_DN75435_c0_g1_i1.p1 TRINITY_DN75435_c0_g1~~TRINITY_DN75435_c0_g1_i1.p1  ORF type:complete len:568 (+),score=85.73 TRINITY_DN75435_c0_g1_i1:145-1704(+)